MELLGINALQIAFILVSTWLGSRTARVYRCAFLAVLALGSIYLGWYGLNLVSPQMATSSLISATGRQLLMISFVTTAVLSGLLLLPSAQRILARTLGWHLHTQQRILGTWLFVIMLLINLAFLLFVSSYSLSLIATEGQGQNALLREFVHDLSYLVIAVLGAGLYMGRHPRAVLERLGLLVSGTVRFLAQDTQEETQTQVSQAFEPRSLCFPNWQEAVGAVLLVGAGIVVLGSGGMLILLYGHIPSLQAIEFALNRNIPLFATNPFQIILVALFFGLAAGITEGILFQGLLQPTFGLVPTAVLFTVLHGQFGFSPALLLVFILGLGCGWLRQRYSTWAAIIAHVLCTTLLIIIWQLLFLY